MTAATQGQAALQYEIDRQKKTGGNAFPVAIDQGDGSTLTHFGMTLRDYFAAQVVADETGSPKQRAKWAYEVADAMLEARKEPS